MSVVAVAAEALQAAVEAVDGVQVHTDVMAPLSPPSVVIGPPLLSWTVYASGEPDGAEFPIIVAVPKDDRAMVRLWDLVPAVTAALESVRDVTVSTAKPRTWGTGDNAFPAYEISASVALSA